MGRYMLLIILIILLFTPAPSEPPSEFNSSIITFETHWDKFLRHLVGCPDTVEINAKNCKPTQGFIDNREFHKSCEAAKDLFKLSGDCNLQ